MLRKTRTSQATTNSTSSAGVSVQETPTSVSTSGDRTDGREQLLSQILQMQKELHSLSESNAKLVQQVERAKTEQHKSGERNDGSQRKRSYDSMRNSFRVDIPPPEAQQQHSRSQPPHHRRQKYYNSSSDGESATSSGAPSPVLDDVNRQNESRRSDRRQRYMMERR